MNYDNIIYNCIRIVNKDDLVVRRSNRIKSGVKYYLDFGRLVKIEHKTRIGLK